MTLIKRGVEKLELIKDLEQLRTDLQTLQNDSKDNKIDAYKYVLKFLTLMMSFWDAHDMRMAALNYYSFGEIRYLFGDRGEKLKELKKYINDYYVRGQSNSQQRFWTTAKPGEKLTLENVYHGNDVLQDLRAEACPHWIARPYTFMRFYCDTIIKLLDEVLACYLVPQNPLVKHAYKRKQVVR